MSEAKEGDTVRIHYTGTLSDGSTFDSSTGRDPLEFRLGSGQVIPGFDDAVNGMAVGEEKTVEIPAAEAYGAADPNGRQAIPRASIPENVPLDPGTRLQMQTPDGKTLQVTVVSADEDEVILDANHPLAGRDLTFRIELVEIV